MVRSRYVILKHTYRLDVMHAGDTNQTTSIQTLLSPNALALALTNTTKLTFTPRHRTTQLIRKKAWNLIRKSRSHSKAWHHISNLCSKKHNLSLGNLIRKLCRENMKSHKEISWGNLMNSLKTHKPWHFIRKYRNSQKAWILMRQ